MLKITAKRLFQFKVTLRGWRMLCADMWFVILRMFIAMGVVIKTTFRNLRLLWSRRHLYKFFPEYLRRDYKAIRHHKDWKRRGKVKIEKAMMKVRKHRQHTKKMKRKGKNLPR